MDYLVHHMLEASANKFPKKEAIVYENERINFSELNAKSNRLASFLQSIGVRKNDRVRVFLSPSVSIVESIFAVSASGGVFVPIHHSLLSDQLAHIIKDCGIKTLITRTEMLSRLDAVALETSSLGQG